MSLLTTNSGFPQPELYRGSPRLQALRAHQRADHNQPELQGMEPGVWRREDDHGAAGQADPPLPHRGDRQRELALQALQCCCQNRRQEETPNNPARHHRERTIRCTEGRLIHRRVARLHPNRRGQYSRKTGVKIAWKSTLSPQSGANSKTCTQRGRASSAVGADRSSLMHASTGLFRYLHQHNTSRFRIFNIRTLLVS